MVKQVIVMRKDLNMRKGKMVTQGSHACKMNLFKPSLGGIEHFEMEFPEDDFEIVIKVKKDTPLHQWFRNGFKKITLGATSEEELLEIYHKIKEANIEVALIQDAGHTEFHGIPTFTAISIGPDFSEKIDPFTGHLPLL